MLEQKKTAKGVEVSAGYPLIERLIDTENFDGVNSAFEGAYNSLMEQARTKRGLKKSRDAKKAMYAIELVMSLFKELLEIKYKIQQMLRASSSKKV
jgi:hypothetical protein